MKMKIVYADGSWLVGKQYFHWHYRETHGTHHFVVVDGSEEFKELIGQKVAVVIGQVKYFVLEC